ncbi:glycosyltransferase family 2 protein [Yoonia sp. BS5-3]|uniref:Glycosyltransferase family 2 protein n=1 Tax=Yoonia phaeophyticola TaxID=3137369 RepID=A0ABZ2V419_9RHOB
MLHFGDQISDGDARRLPVVDHDDLTTELIHDGLLTPQDAAEARQIARRQAVPLHDVLWRTFDVPEFSIAGLLAERAGTQLINPVEQRPDLSLILRYGAQSCLRNGLMPWRQIGSETIVLTTRPEWFSQHSATLRAIFGPVRMAVTTREHLYRSINTLCGDLLVEAAETKVRPSESCRDWNPGRALWVGILILLAAILASIFAPQAFIALLTGWAIITLVLTTALKAVAAFIGWRTRPVPAPNVTPARLPVISVLVPLYNETAIAEHLLARLKALDYPRALLDICLVLEADDTTTRATLGRTTLPTWMRAIVVPKGTVKTKPRALNYALDFARGSIIGIWDAEDAPAPDQLRIVADHFAKHGPEVACLQGTLDYYNAGTNWLTRCFTIEYASWFRVILPGLQRLGLVIPLGGTTLFFRRGVIEELGGWDAHNVTEDADLGVRLARHGYRTELIQTVTEEEANGRAWPWVKQRSRWLKGYAITYGVHMRDPGALWQDLGGWRFFGVQLLFLGTLSQFVLAPLLWSFWLSPFGFSHPLSGLLPSWGFWALAGLFILSELVGFAAAIVGLRKAEKPWLIKWALTLQFYFPLGAMAAYKGLWELARRPFYWDKTAHGVLLPKGWHAKTTAPPQQLGRPVLDG